MMGRYFGRKVDAQGAMRRAPRLVLLIYVAKQEHPPRVSLVCITSPRFSEGAGCKLLN